jgi:pimeloyl-ACP methyl ester carboxylesterase
VPERLPPWLTEQDRNFFTSQFKQSGFRGGVNWYRNLDRNWELTPFLDGAKIILPTVFAAGDRDMVLEMRRDGYEALETNAPHLQKKYLIPGAGHWIQQERPKEINQLLIEFLQDL